MKFKKLGAFILGAILTIGVAAGLGTSFESNKAEAATYTELVKVTSSSTLDTNKEYVYGTGNTDTAKFLQISTTANTSSWGKIASSLADATKFKVSGTISSFYLYAGNYKVSSLTSNNFSATTSTPADANKSSVNANGNLINAGTTARNLRLNGSSGWRWYANTTGSQGYLYEIKQAASLSSIEAKIEDANKTWYVEDTVTLNDITVTATYSDSSTKPITSGVTLTNSTLSNVGTNTITVSYTENNVTKTTTLSITAQAQRTLTGVTIVGDMSKKEYNVGDSWDLSGLYLDLTYSVGDKEQIPLTELTNGEHYLLDPENASDININSLYICGEYEGFEFEKTITGISVKKVFIDTLNRALTSVSNGSSSYTAWSDKADATGIKYAGNSAGGNDSIQLRTTNNNSGIVSTTNNVNILIDKVEITWQSSTTSGRVLDVYGSNVAYSAPTDLYDTSKQGTKLGSITYGTSTELTVSGDYSYIGLRSSSGAMYLTEVKIYYKEPVVKTVTSLEVTTNPTKTIYSVGEDFDPEGMVVTATYSDSSSEDVTTSCTFSPSVIANDTNEITISYTYEGNTTTCTLPITLKAVKDVTGVASMPNVYVGDTVDAGQFELNVLYNDGTTGVVQADEVVIDTTTKGTKEATATYNGASGNKTVTFEIEVYGLTSLSWTDRGDHVAFEGSPLSEAFDTAGWKFAAKYNDDSKTEVTPAPVFGTGENDVHIALYDTRNPETENAPLTSDYVFTLEDDGKYLVACYKGVFSSSNNPLDVVEKLNNITSIVSGSKETEIKLAGTTGALNGTTISWETDGITITNEKGQSTTDIRTSDADHYRCYAKSILKINSDVKIEQIEFTCTSSEYAENLVTSIGNANATNDGTAVTWKSVNATSITINLSAQVRIKSLVVYGSGETTYEYANNNLKAQAAVMEFVNFFNATMSADGACNVNGVTDYTSDTFVEAWNKVAAKWDELFGADSKLSSEDLAHAKAMFVNAEAYWNNEYDEADSLQRAMRTYDKVTSNTDLSKFIEGRPKVEDNGSGIKALIDDNASTIALIVIIALFSGLAFLFVSKRKQAKIEL